jgi:hypothetical protein
VAGVLSHVRFLWRVAVWRDSSFFSRRSLLRWRRLSGWLRRALLRLRLLRRGREWENDGGEKCDTQLRDFQ